MKRGYFSKAGVACLSVVLMLTFLVIPAQAAAISDDFEGYASTEDVNLNWFGYGDFISDVSLNKVGGVNASKCLKVSVDYDENVRDRWATLRGCYPDDMTSKVATGFRFWAKSSVEGQKAKVLMVYNNMSWKYAAEVTLSKTGKYYDVPFSSMKKDYGTVTIENGKDPQFINEWQFEFPRTADTEQLVILLDDISYIGDGPTAAVPDKPTDKPTDKPAEKTTVSAPVPVEKPTEENSAPENTGTQAAPTETDGRTDIETTYPEVEDTEPNNEVKTTALVSQDTENNEKGGMSGGTIAAIVVAVVAVLVAVGVTVYFTVIRKKNG